MQLGYTMLCEQAGPKQLVRDVVAAEEAGFDFAVISENLNEHIVGGAGPAPTCGTGCCARQSRSSVPSGTAGT